MPKQKSSCRAKSTVKVVAELNPLSKLFSKNRKAVAELNPLFKQFSKNRKMRVQVASVGQPRKEEAVLPKQKSSCRAKSTVKVVAELNPLSK